MRRNQAPAAAAEAPRMGVAPPAPAPPPTDDLKKDLIRLEDGF